MLSDKASKRRLNHGFHRRSIELCVWTCRSYQASALLRRPNRESTDRLFRKRRLFQRPKPGFFQLARRRKSRERVWARRRHPGIRQFRV